MLQYGLQECSPLMAWRLLIKHACLDHLLIHVQLVLCSCQDLFLHAVHGAESQYPDLVLLADAVSAVLGLQILCVGTRCHEGPCAQISLASQSHTQKENMGGWANSLLLNVRFCLHLKKYTSYLLWEKNSRSLLVEGSWVKISQDNWNTSQVSKSRSQDDFICP